MQHEGPTKSEENNHGIGRHIGMTGLKCEIKNLQKQNKHKTEILRNTIISYLVEFHEHEDSNEIHEGRVELEGDLGGADVVAGGHDALHGQSQTHRVVQAVLSGNSQTGEINIFNSIFIFHLFVNFFLKAFIFFLSNPNNHHEENAEETIAKVAENVIEVTQRSQASSAEIIVVADIVVSGHDLLMA